METLIASEEKQAPANLKTTSSTAFTVSLVIFLSVLIGTLGLKAYIYVLDTTLDDTNAKITEIENTIIQTKQRNPEVNAYSLWSKAKDSIESQIRKSEAQAYLNQLDSIARSLFRKIAFSGFSFTDGKVETHAVAFGTSGDAAMNIIELLRRYRGEPKDIDPLFDLSPILTLDGDASRREFGVTFTTKNILPAMTAGAPVTGSGTSTGSVQYR